MGRDEQAARRFSLLQRRVATLERELASVRENLASAQSRADLAWHNPSLFWLKIDATGRVLAANDGFLDHTGWHRGQVIGEPWVETFIPAVAREDIYQLFKRTLQGERVSGHVTSVLTSAGHTIRVRWWSRTRILTNGESVMTAMGIPIPPDIPDHGELSMVDVYRSVGDLLDDGIFVCTADLSNLVYMNVSALSRTGMPPEQVYAHPEWMMKGFDARSAAIIQRLLEAPPPDEPSADTVAFHTHYLQPDGTDLLVLNRFCVVRDREGKAAFLGGTSKVVDTNIGEHEAAAPASFLRQHRGSLQVLEGLPFPGILVDDQSRLVLLNSSARALGELSTTSHRNLVDLPWFNNTTDGLGQLGDAVQRALLGRTTQAECQMRVHGEVRQYVITVAPLAGPQGMFACLTLYDITELGRLTRQLETSELRLRALLDGLPLGAFLSDPGGDSLYCNAYIAKLFGVSAEEMKGTGWRKSKHAAAFAALAPRFSDLEMGEVREIELPEIPGHPLEPQRLSVKRVEVAGLEAPLVVGTVRSAQRELRALRALAAAEDLSHKVQRIAGVGHWTWQIQTGELEWSSGTHSIFGIPESHAPNYSLFLSLVPPEEQRQLDQAVAVAIRDATPYYFRHSATRPDGTTITVIEQGEVEYDPDTGDPVRIVGTVLDITMLAKHEEDLGRAADRRTLLMRELNHRVKNNLGIVSSLLRLQARNTDNPTVAAALRQGVQRLDAMTLCHQLLMSSESLELLDLGNYLSRLARALETSASRSPIQVVLGTRRPTLRLEQTVAVGLLANELLTNAVKHGLPRSIRLELTVNDNDVLMTVINTLADSPPSNGGQLGIRITELLAAQLNGSMIVEQSDNHYRATLHLPNVEIDED